MAGPKRREVVLDTTVLSNFASSGSTGELTGIIEAPLTTAAVRSELQDGIDHGHAYLQNALERLGSEIRVVSIDDETATNRVERQLDRGERHSLATALERDAAFATDDLAGREAASAASVPVTGSIGLLVLGVERNVVDRRDASAWLERWEVERGYYAPVDSLDELLDANGD